jgi:PAS domain S-box-containing protein
VDVYGQSRGRWEALRRILPEGRLLPEAEWRTRHRGLMAVVWGHVLFIAVFGISRDWPYRYALGEAAVVGLIAILASVPAMGRRVRASLSALALVLSSTAIIQFSGGYIEAHFHFFIVIALIALYEDWTPFLMAIGYVVLSHGILGGIVPAWIYNHQGAFEDPWKWAAIHGGLVVGECIAVGAMWKAAEKERARNELILNSAGEGIVGIDVHGRITFANPAAGAMIGASPRSLEGRYISQYLRDELRQVPQFQYSAAFRPRIREGIILRGTQDPMEVEWLAMPVLARGHLHAWVLTFADVSERKEALRQQTEASQKLVEMGKLKELAEFRSELLNLTAHELNTPLTPIQIELRLLREDLKDLLNGEQEESMESVLRNVDRLGRLVKDILDAARLQSNRMGIQKLPLDLNVLVQQSVRSFRESARENGISLEAKVGPELPVLADPSRISQVLTNLLSNAIKFTHAGGSVVLTTERRGVNAVVQVRDTGVGVEPRDMAKLFQPFSQIQLPEAPRGPGTGLGLYISHSLLDMHGGRIWCQSDGRDRGATFSFELPLDLTRLPLTAQPTPA